MAASVGQPMRTWGSQPSLGRIGFGFEKSVGGRRGHQIPRKLGRKTKKRPCVISDIRALTAVSKSSTFSTSFPKQTRTSDKLVNDFEPTDIAINVSSAPADDGDDDEALMSFSHVLPDQNAI